MIAAAFQAKIAGVSGALRTGETELHSGKGPGEG